MVFNPRELPHDTIESTCVSPSDNCLQSGLYSPESQSVRNALFGKTTKPDAADVLPQTRIVDEKTLVKQKEAELQQRFNVSFVPDGESIPQNRIGAQGLEPNGKTVLTRDPTLGELAAVEAALTHSQPTNSGNIDGTTLRFQFLRESNMENGDPAAANFEGPWKDQPKYAMVNIGPDAKNFLPTEKDVIKAKAEGRDIPPGIRQSLEGILTHELGHSTIEHLRTIPGKKAENYMKDAGWVPLKQPADSAGTWALKGKDGSLYQQLEDPDQKKEGWVKIEANAGYDSHGNYKGRYIGANGEPITSPLPSSDGPPDVGLLARGKTLDPRQMMDQALVRPATGYFDNANEALAEALTNYRLSADLRKDLLSQSTEMYKIAKDMDQQEIDKAFGQGQKVRLPDGNVVSNSRENQKIIEDFEKQQARS